MSKKYISDVFKNDVLVDGDIRQTLTYKFVKSYPSINSTNGGQIHSEENVRWLTKQFTHKPFIIPYTNNETFDEFWYEGAVLNAGKCNGGMVNIDGYIINTANNTLQTSFDNEEDTKFASDGNGYIEHHRLQRAIGQILSQFSSSIQTYISRFTTKWQGVDLTTNLTLLMHTLSYNYKKYINEDVSDIDPSTIVSDLHQWFSEISENSEPITVRSSYIDIEYHDTLGEYIFDNFNINNLTTNYADIIETVQDISTTDTDEYNNVITHHAYRITYKVYYGIIIDKFVPKKNIDTGNYIPSIYVKDLFGLYYIWSDNTNLVTTNNYPSTYDTNINFMMDTITPQDGSGNIARGTTLQQSALYDYSTKYQELPIATHPEYVDFANTVNSIGNVANSLYTGLSAPDIFIRDDINHAITPQESSLPINITTSAIYNSTYFDIVTSDVPINLYKTFNNNVVTLDDFKRGGPLYNLCDFYYCLPLNKLHPDFKRLICTKNNVTTEVGFLTSSGALMARNYQYTKKVNGENNTIVYIEGYVTFFRRLVALLCPSINIYTMPDINEYHNEAWNAVLKDFQLGKIQADISSLDADTMNMFNDIFHGESITFELLYNTILAPYINLHIQTAWSSLYTFNVEPNNSTNSKYKTHWGYNILKDNIVEDASLQNFTKIVDDTTAGVNYPQTPHINVERIHTYSDGTDIYETHKYLTYLYNEYTDNNRLSSFLCNNKSTELTEGLTYWNYLNFEDSSNRYEMCEDYISYLKCCSCRGWDDTYNNYIMRDNELVRIDRVNIKYKVTGLSSTSPSTYGFDIINKIIDRVSKFVNFDTSTTIGDTRYKELTETNLQSNEQLFAIDAGYINNVCINLDTLCPYRRDHNNNAFYYPNATSNITQPGQINASLPNTYNLWMTSFNTIEYDGAQSFGLSGYSFSGRSQGMVTYIPMLLRLYKDSQNYLNGIKNDGSTTHAGIYVDYKFPDTIDVQDFWFANTWLSNVSFVATWNIESHATTYPLTTDGLQSYLDTRNKTILSINQLYDIDNNGEYKNFSQIINNYFENNNTNWQEDINRIEDEIINVEFTFNKAVPTVRNDTIPEITDLIYKNVTITGLENAIKETQQQINHITNVYTYRNPTIINNVLNLTLVNNKFYDFRGTVVPEILFNFQHFYTGIDPDTQEPYDYFNEGLDINNHTIFKTTIRLTIEKQCKLNLNNSPYNIVSNVSSINNHIPIRWTSNYPIINCGLQTEDVVPQIWNEDGLKYGVVNDYIIINNTVSSTTTDILIDITVEYNSTLNTADAYCNISYLNENNQLTLSDVDYLVRANYNLSRLTWEQISTLTKLGMASRLWNLGDTKTFKLYYEDSTTHETTSVDVQAQIIGFNQDGPNTITWMTRWNDATHPYGELTTKFNTELTTSANDGYNKYWVDHGADTTVTTNVWEWLNGNTNSIAKSVESELKAIILPARKITRPLYLVKDENASTYHKYHYVSDTEGSYGYYKNYFSCKYTEVNNDYIVPANTYDKYGEYGGGYGSQFWNTDKGGDPFWLPSIYELGLSPFDLYNNGSYNEHIDEAEYSAYEQAIDETNSYYDKNVVRYNSLRILPQEANNGLDKINSPIITYDYFKQPKIKQDIIANFICRDYYAVKSTDVSDTSVDFTTESMEDLYSKYQTANRGMYYATLIPYESGSTWKYYLELQDRTSASAVTHLTGFCFVTY